MIGKTRTCAHVNNFFFRLFFFCFSHALVVVDTYLIKG